MPPPQRHPRLCGYAAPPPGPSGAGWHALASSASTPRPTHTAALARVCTPPQLWLASASPEPVPVCAAPFPPPTPAGVCGLAQPPCRRGPHTRTGWDVAGGAVGARSRGRLRGTGRRGTRPAAPASAGHRGPAAASVATSAAEEAWAPAARLVARARVVWAIPPRRTAATSRRTAATITPYTGWRGCRAARPPAPAPPSGPAVSRVGSVSSAAARARWSQLTSSLACRPAPKLVQHRRRRRTAPLGPVQELRSGLGGAARAARWVVPTAAPAHDQRHLARLGEGATTTLAVPIAPSSIYNRMARGAQTVLRGDPRGVDPQGRRLLAPSRGVLLPEHVHDKARVEPVCCRADRVASPSQPAGHTSIPPATRSTVPLA